MSTTQTHLAPRLKMSRDVPPLYASTNMLRGDLYLLMSQDSVSHRPTLLFFEDSSVVCVLPLSFASKLLGFLLSAVGSE